LSREQAEDHIADKHGCPFLCYGRAWWMINAMGRRLMAIYSS
jgi:hypothetical protein